MDTTSKRKRNNAPDPAVFTNCQVGEPASIENTYTNYVQAVPDSLFNTKMGGEVYADRVPPQPRVHSYYKINRVLNVDSQIPNAHLRELNDLLNIALQKLGPQKQANFNVIVTGITDPAFRHTVENAWLGGEKNDITVFIGVEGTTIVWTDVMTFALNSGNELFHVTLRDELAELGTFEPQAIAAAIATNTANLYDRIQMEDFEYLSEQITPPTWVLIIAIFLSIGGSIGLSWVMTRVDFRLSYLYDRYQRPRFRRFR
jgi:hypothetical protein